MDVGHKGYSEELCAVCGEGTADDAIVAFLLERKAPVMEVELLRLYTGAQRLPGDMEGLFRAHFSLYHRLYRIKEDLAGHYLHLDPMRIRLLPLPEKGSCGFYLPGPGAFCGDRTAPGRALCVHHGEILPAAERIPFFDPLRSFYTDEGNLSYGSFDLLKRIMAGVITYSFNRKKMDEAMDLLGLARPDRALLERRYRILARRYHPDLHGGDEAMMKRVNDAYALLKTVFFA